MRTKTEQKYIVHLDIPATAVDPSEAVQGALEQVRLGGLGDFGCSVEKVGGGAMFLNAPTQHTDSDEVQGRPRSGARRAASNRYAGEFLG